MYPRVQGHPRAHGRNGPRFKIRREVRNEKSACTSLATLATMCSMSTQNRSARFRARKKASGFSQMTIFVPDEQRQHVREYVAKLCQSATQQKNSRPPSPAAD